MLRDLSQLAAQKQTDAEDFRKAAAFLVSRQFIYQNKRSQKGHYALISDCRTYFSNLFDALGWDLLIDETAKCIGLLPREEGNQRRLSLADTVLLLALRVLYEKELESLRMSSTGSVSIDAASLYTFFDMANATKPPPGKLVKLLKGMESHGLVTISDAETEESVAVVEIHPAIKLATDDYAEARLRDLDPDYLPDPGTPAAGTSVHGTPAAGTSGFDPDEDEDQGGSRGPASEHGISESGTSGGGHAGSGHAYDLDSSDDDDEDDGHLEDDEEIDVDDDLVRAVSVGGLAESGGSEDGEHTDSGIDDAYSRNSRESME